MKINLKKITLFMIAGMMITHLSFSQQRYTIEASNQISMKLSGTSTLHNWSMNSGKVEGEAQFILSNKAQLVDLKSLTFALVVKNLKSDSKGLDENAYEALKADQHKAILYNLTSVMISPEKDSSYLLRTHGDLTIAGVTKEIMMNVSCSIDINGAITCKGSETLNMTDFKVKPPTFFMGAMKTGEVITLDFTMVYKTKKDI